MNIRLAITTACTSLGLERLDAQLLLLHALGKPLEERAWLIAHDDDALDPQVEERYIELARQRAAGRPVAYLTGRREFYGLQLQVDSRVLDPRADTETLVNWALDLLKDKTKPEVIDLGAGSGAIALAISRNRPDAKVHALDTSEDALAVARANAERLQLPVLFTQADWLAGHEGYYDLIVSNPPYIAEGDEHLDKLRHEPQLALTSGVDGLDAIRTIIRQAVQHLKPGGWLLFEHGWKQAAAVRDLLTEAGFTQVQSRRDLAGIERCSGGQLN